MIIEFIAIPGSGKTYLSNQLLNYITGKQYHGINVYNSRMIKEFGVSSNKMINRCCRILQLLFWIDSKIIYLLMFLLFYKKGYKNKKTSALLFIDKLMIYGIIKKIIKKDNERSIFILDEGLLHTSELFVNNIKKQLSIEKYQSIIEKSKVISKINHMRYYIFVNSNEEVNYKRIQERKQGWPSMWTNLTDNEKYEALKESNVNYNKVKKYMKERSNNIIEINNAQDNCFKEFDILISLTINKKGNL